MVNAWLKALDASLCFCTVYIRLGCPCLLKEIPSGLWWSGAALYSSKHTEGSWEFNHPVYICFVDLDKLMTVSLWVSCCGNMECQATGPLI